MVTLTSSLVVALIINPALAAIFARVKGQRPLQAVDEKSAAETVATGEQPVAVNGRLLTGYVGLLESGLAHRGVVLISSFVLLVILIQVWLLAVGLEKPVEFFPKIDPKSLYVNVEPPEGADLDYIDLIVKKVEMGVNGAILQNPELPRKSL